MQQHTTITVSYTDPETGLPASVEMLQAEFITKGPSRFEKWGVCVICNFSYPLSKMVDGTHCIPLGHYKEIKKEGGIKVGG